MSNPTPTAAEVATVTIFYIVMALAVVACFVLYL